MILVNIWIGIKSVMYNCIKFIYGKNNPALDISKLIWSNSKSILDDISKFHKGNVDIGFVPSYI